ncbi:hypothetical protein BDW72DRAFT_94737 [Aspergillus terricola var. indicus]
MIFGIYMLGVGEMPQLKLDNSETTSSQGFLVNPCYRVPAPSCPQRKPAQASQGANPQDLQDLLTVEDPYGPPGFWTAYLDTAMNSIAWVRTRQRL